MKIEKISDKTVAAKFKRLSYFHGMLLTEDDLFEEQTYLREKLKMHNRLHGTGVVRGLKVQTAIFCGCTTCENMDEYQMVVINPGFALDCEGNEVIVCNTYHVDLSDEIKYLLRVGALDENSQTTCEQTGDTAPVITVGIVYGECCSNPATQYVTTCDADSPTKEYSRVREGFRVVIGLEYGEPVETQQPFTASSQCMPSPFRCHGADPDCSDRMVIPLARITMCKLNQNDMATHIGDEKIDDVREYAWTVETLSQWEKARQELLLPIIKPEIDISPIIRQPVADARKMLDLKGITVNESVLRPSEVNVELLEKIQTASPKIPKGSSITLISDETGKKILFALRDEDAVGSVKAKRKK